MIHPAHHHYHLARMSPLGRVVWAHSLSVFAGGLVTVFVPIFLLKTGYPLPEVLTYLMLQGLFSVPLQLVLAPVIAKYGANRLMAASLLCQVVFLLLLLTLSAVQWPLALLAFLWAAHRTAYWIPFHIDFSKQRSHHKTGRQIGGLNMAKIIASGLAPAVGGIVATEFGIGWTYGVAAGLFLVAGGIMLRSSDVTSHRPPSMKLLNLKKIRPDLLANTGNSITSCAENVTWPILVSLIVPTYAAIGLLSSVVIIVSVFVAFYVGRRQAVRGPRRYLRQGITLAGISDGFRLVAQNANHVFGINAFWGIGASLYYTPFMTQYYEHSDEEPRIEYLTAMEVAHELAWAGFFFILLILSSFLPDKVVLLAGIAIAIPGNYLITRMR